MSRMIGQVKIKAGNIIAYVMFVLYVQVAALSYAEGTSQIEQDDSFNAAQEMRTSRSDTSIIVASAYPRGVYDQLAQGICRIVNHVRTSTKLKCYTQSSSGSIQNLKEVQSNSLMFGLTQAELLKDAFNGAGAFAKLGAEHKLRFIASLHDEALTIVVRGNGKIKTLDDLVNKTVNLGSENSGLNSIMQSIMSLKGWDKKTFAEVVDLAPLDQASALCKGAIDVMITVEGMPSPSVIAASKMCEIAIIPLEPSIAKKLSQMNYEFHSIEIPGGQYLGVANTVPTIATKAILITNDNTSEDVVYTIVKVLFESINYIKQINPALANLNEDSMYQSSNTIPRHAGAEKYFQERGFKDKKAAVPVKADPSSSTATAPSTATNEAGGPLPAANNNDIVPSAPSVPSVPNAPSIPSAPSASNKL